ncbi:MAG: MBL fold metallo-hydrolase [Candidatus Thorarchaeota archaeon]
MFEKESFNDDIIGLKTATAGPDGNAIMWVYAYHIGNSMFDACCGNSRTELETYLSKRQINDVYISHAHEDHFGCVDLFAGKADVYAWKSGIDLLREPIEIGEFFQYVWGQPKPIKDVRPMQETFAIGDYRFEVIEVPGHMKDMVAFFEPDRKWLFSSDAVPLPSRKYIAMPDENIPRMIKSMEHIQTLGIEILFDSHRGPIESPSEHIQRRIDYLKETQGKVKEMHNDGLSYSDMIEKLEIEPPWYIEMTKDRFSVEFFLRSLLEDEP